MLSVDCKCQVCLQSVVLQEMTVAQGSLSHPCCTGIMNGQPWCALLSESVVVHFD